VLTVQEKVADKFPLEQTSWKADVRQSNQEIPRFNGKWTHELKIACHLRPLWHYPFFFLIGCQPCIPQLQILLL